MVTTILFVTFNIFRLADVGRQRNDAEDEGERGHHDRPQSQPAGGQGGILPAVLRRIARETN